MPQEATVRLLFAPIGIGPGKPFDSASLSDAQKGEIGQAVKDGYAAIQQRRDAIGRRRERLEGRFARSATATSTTVIIFAGPPLPWPVFSATTPRKPCIRPLQADAIGIALDGSKHNYTLTFAANKLPPVNAFWSVTMYDGKTQLLIENPINRYLINSPMLPGLKKNPDGSLTIYMQKDAPSGRQEGELAPGPQRSHLLGDAAVLAAQQVPPPPPSILPAGAGTWEPPAILTTQ